MSAAGTPGALSAQAQQQAIFGASTIGAPTGQGGLATPAPAAQVTPSPQRGLATVIKERIGGGTDAELVTGLKAQLEVFNASPFDATKAGAVIETLNEDQLGLKIFAGMSEGSKIRTFWGFGKVYDPTNVMDVTEGPTAFLGDRDKYGNPPTVVGLPPRGYLAWVKVKTDFDEDAFEAHYADAANQNTLKGAVTGAGAESHWLPRLLYCPGGLGEFVAKKPRAPAELLTEAKRLAADPSSGVTEQMVELVKKWCIGAATKDASHPRSMLHLATTPVTSDAEEFTEFIKRKCDGILGPAQVPGGAQSAGTQVDYSAQFQAMATTLVSSLAQLQQLNNSNSGGQTQHSGGMDASGLKQGKDFETAEKIQICGWSGKDNFADTSPLWRDLAATSNLTTRREKLRKVLNDFATKYGFPVNTTTFFPEKFFTEVLSLKMDCDEAVATFRNLGRGFSAQTCLAVTLKYIAEQTEFENHQNESKNQRTFEESVKISKAAAVQRSPPTTLEQFKLATSTYAALLWGFFTDSSPLFNDVLSLRQAMELPQVTQKQECYTAAVLCPHWYAILNFSRAFFHVRMNAEDLKAQPPRFPQSMLKAVVPSFISGKPWEDATFPMEWRTRLFQPPPLPSGGVSPWTGGKQPPQQRGGGTGNEHSGSGTEDVTQQLKSLNLDHVHPTIRKEFKEYHETFKGAVKLLKLCDASNVSIHDLPYVTSVGREKMCYSYIMGICQGNQCNRTHVAKEMLHPTLVKELCEVTKAGREYLIRNVAEETRDQKKRKVFKR